jgi:class 3 adenylate cyclase
VVRVVESSGRTLVCSVLFLDIAEYSRKSVAEQLEVKQAFNDALKQALEQVAPRDRVVLDTGDGAAVTFLGDPEDALFAAMAFRNMTRALKIRLGINLGPVRLLRDVNTQINMIGDGINVAQRIMSFAAPGQLLVSRSFYEVVSCLSRDYATLFRHEGSRTDKHVREHEVYSVGEDGPAARRVADTVLRLESTGGLRRWITLQGPLGFQRSALIAAPLLFVLLVGAGLTLRPTLERATSSTTPAPALSAPQDAARSPAPQPASPAPSADGRVQFAIAPWGAVFVDGKRVGVSPPLRELKLSPGEHEVEIRNTAFPPHIQKVNIKSGGVVRIRHRFR